MIHISDAVRLDGFAERFWKSVNMSGGPDACWPWIGPVSKRHGYGKTWRCGDKRWFPAHRAALLLADFRIAGRWDFACHHCDNRACCNPGHLYWGTATSNAKDREARLRSRPQFGADHHSFVDLTGRKFGLWTAESFAGCGERGSFWLCVCDCGHRREVSYTSLVRGSVYSCGCIDLTARGERHPMSKLKECDVLEIRRLSGEGHTRASLARRFGVCHPTIVKIVKRERWASL